MKIFVRNKAKVSHLVRRDLCYWWAVLCLIPLMQLVKSLLIIVPSITSAAFVFSWLIKASISNISNCWASCENDNSPTNTFHSTSKTFEERLYHDITTANKMFFQMIFNIWPNYGKLTILKVIWEIVINTCEYLLGWIMLS